MQGIIILAAVAGRKCGGYNYIKLRFFTIFVTKPLPL